MYFGSAIRLILSSWCEMNGDVKKSFSKSDTHI